MPSDDIITNCANKYARLVIQGHAFLAHSGLYGDMSGEDMSMAGSMHAKMSAHCGK